jgi:hypothetical protein
MIFVAFKVHQVRVYQRTCYASVAKSLLDMQDVFGFMLFHGAVPMAQCVEGYPLDSWILKLLGDSVSLPHASQHPSGTF